MLAKCLNQQNFREFEHIVVTKNLDIWSKNFKITYDPEKNRNNIFNPNSFSPST